MKNLIEDNYNVTVKRGLITAKTTLMEFLLKIQEESDELSEEINFMIWNNNKEPTPAAKEELCDVILVCLNMARHYNINIEKELLAKIDKNRSRIKNL